MTTEQTKLEVATLLSKRQELRRLGLELPPDQLMLLKRLLYRLGWTSKMSKSRRGVLHMAKAKVPGTREKLGLPPEPTPSDLVSHAGAVLDNPRDDAGMMALADHVAERHGDDPHAQAFLDWVTGRRSWNDITPRFRTAVHGQLPADGGAYVTLGGSHRVGQPGERPPGEAYNAAHLDTAHAATGQVSKRHDQPYWIMRRPAVNVRWHPDTPETPGGPSTGRHRKAVELPGTKMSGTEVAQWLHDSDGLRSLLLAVIGSRHFHPDTAAERTSGARTHEVRFQRGAERVTRPGRGGVVHMAKKPVVQVDYPAIVRHAAAALDAPHDDTAVRSFADHLAETHEGDMANAFVGWANGETDHRPLLPFIRPGVLGHEPRGPYQDRTPEAAAEQGAPEYEIRSTTDLPGFGRRWDQPGWTVRRRATRTRHGMETTPAQRGLVTTLEVARRLYERGGPASLVQAVMGARVFHPNGRRRGYNANLNVQDTKFSRPVTRGAPSFSQEGRGGHGSLPRKVVRYRSFDERNAKAKNDAQRIRSETKRHVKRGQHVCRGCWKHYHVIPRGRKCRECGGDVYTVTKSSRIEGGEVPVVYGPKRGKKVPAPPQREGYYWGTNGRLVNHSPDYNKDPFKVLIHRDNDTGNYHVKGYGVSNTPQGPMWTEVGHLGSNMTLQGAKNSVPKVLHSGGLEHPNMNGGGPVPLTPHELWGFDLPGGEVPHAPPPDELHTTDTGEQGPSFPEDHYAMGRTHHTLPRKVVRYAMVNRSSAIDALRRAFSTNNQALHEIAYLGAKRVGVGPTKVFSAVHIAPHGSVPGVVQAVYGNAPRERINALGSWVALTGNQPGMATIHLDPKGPDTLYRVRVLGGMMDLPPRLERLGIRNATLLKHGKGYDALILDEGSKMGNAVNEFARIHGTVPEASRGHLEVVGSADQGQARDRFRTKVVAQERT